MRTLTLVCLTIACGWTAYAPTPSFALREMDMHLHAGLEREVPLNEWVDLAATDGRKALLLLDHLELYRMNPEEYKEWSSDHDGRQRYPMGEKGRRALMADFDAVVTARPDLQIFKGWEVCEFELDEGLEEAPMDTVDVIGWHISANSDDGPGGQLLIKRINQIKAVQQRHPVPMVIFHPFPAHFERLTHDAKKAGKDPGALTVDECRFFKPGEQDEVIRLLKNTSLYIEMGHGTARYWENPVMREALIADIKPLADAGVTFTVSTDNHRVAGAKTPFHPEVYCEPCGITVDNANTLIRELCARKAKLK